MGSMRRSPTQAKKAKRKKAKRKPPVPLWQKQVAEYGELVVAMAIFVLLGGYAVQSDIWPSIRFALVDKFVDISSDKGLELQEMYAIGLQRTKSVDIRHIAEMYYGQNILTVDIETIQREIEKLPWVRSAAVSRQLPDRIVIEIAERKPMALWQHDGEVRLIDDKGDIVPLIDLQPFVAMPVVSGPDAPEHTADLFKSLLRESDLARRVTAAQRVDRRRWNVFLDGEIEIRLPDERISDAWKMLAAAERQDRVLNKAISAVDLRSGDWLILRLIDDAIEGGMAGEQEQPT